MRDPASRIGRELLRAYTPSSPAPGFSSGVASAPHSRGRCTLTSPTVRPGGALAMLLDPSCSPPPASERRWYAPQRAPCVPEPGRLATNALINVARRERGCRTRGDDRLETRAYAVKRLLHRWSQAKRSARFACSIAQLVHGLAPILGWGKPPVAPGERERWVRAHRKSVQRWLEDLQRAGLLTFEGERDNRGQLWRTVITLHAPPTAPEEQMRVARQRLGAFRRRARRRQTYRRRRARTTRARRAHTRLEHILGCSARPQRATRARLALHRACLLHETRRRRAVEAHLTDLCQRKDRTHPFGASTPSKKPLIFRKPTIKPPTSKPTTPTTVSPHETPQNNGTVSSLAGARAQEHESNAPTSTKNQVPAKDSGAPTAAGDPLADVEHRIQAALAASAWRRHEVARQALARAQRLLVARPDIDWGLGRLREAWVVFRFGVSLRIDFGLPESGPERVGDHGSSDAGPRRPGQRARAERAIALYERFAAHRPPAWPLSGAGALCALAAQRQAATFEGEIARLRALAKRMRAVALQNDVDRLQRAQQRAKRRHRPADLGGWSFRLHQQRPRFETPEGRRRRVRDELLRHGEHPGLSPHVFDEAWEAALRHDTGHPHEGDPDHYPLPDGMTARAQRYQQELAEGRWTLPNSLQSS